MKKIFLFAATAAMILSSCSESEVTEVYSDNDNNNNIGLQMASYVSKNATVTTSGIINSASNTLNLSSNDATGFATQGFTNGAAGDNWTIDNGSTWSIVKTWPLYLYSANDGTNGGGDVTVTAGTTGTFSYGINTIVADQKDLVCFGTSLQNQPGNGLISATFTHALSRVYVTADVTDGTETNIDAFIASVKLVNVSDKADATITPVAGDVCTVGWANFDTKDAKFSYLTSTTAPTTAVTDGANLSATANDNMFILPQELVGPEYDATTTDEDDIKVGDDLAGKSYVEVIYRWNRLNPTAPVVGGDDEAALGRGTSAGTDALFVKVAFPLNYTFENNRMYNIILPMDGTGNGGYLLDPNFVKADGSSTTIKFDPTDTKVAGDAVLSDDEIGLTVVEVVEYETPEKVIDENVTTEGTVLD